MLKRYLAFLMSLAFTLNANSIVPDGNVLKIYCSEDPAGEVFYVDFPATVLAAPSQKAYSFASITKDAIYLSGINGLLIDGSEPNTGVGCIKQCYQNLANIMDYLDIPLKNIVKLEILLAAEDKTGFQNYYELIDTVQKSFWKDSQPARTISAVKFLKCGMIEISATVKHSKKLKIKKVVSRQ